jgi:putative tryptophan/tyrosine transport system substrate-binding protein
MSAGGDLADCLGARERYCFLTQADIPSRSVGLCATLARSSYPLGKLGRALVRRRQFLAVFCGGTVWPLVASAQQANQVGRVGVLMAIREDDPLRPSYIDAFAEGLRAVGRLDGKNIQIDYHWAGPDIARIKQAAKEIIAGHPSVVVAHTSPATAALIGETSTTPIVFVTVTEPLAQGFVKGLASPGGNVTGFMNFEFSMGGKWIEILKEILPGVKQAKVMFNPETAPGGGDIFLRSIEAGARSLAIDISPVSVHSTSDIEGAIAALGNLSGTGLIIPPDIFLTANRSAIVEFAAKFRVPTIYQYDYFVRDGGLVSYGVDFPDLFGRAAGYVDQLLNGRSAANLPVQAPTKFQLAVNLKAASALGLTLPPTLLTRADEVIE